MAKNEISSKRGSGSDKDNRPGEKGGSASQNAQKWGGGTKASKGRVSKADKRNENSSAKR